jgi:hypothetical protein
MDSIIVLAILSGIAWWTYKRGKREGSRKGFNVGRRRSTRRRR